MYDGERISNYLVATRAERVGLERVASMTTSSILSSLLIGVLVVVCVSGCAQEYTGETHYDSKEGREEIHLKDNEGFYPIFLFKTWFPVFICGTSYEGSYTARVATKACTRADSTATGQCVRVYWYHVSTVLKPSSPPHLLLGEHGPLAPGQRRLPIVFVRPGEPIPEGENAVLIV